MDAFIAEPYAMVMGANFCKEIGIAKFLIEGDALQVVNLLNGPTIDWS